MGEKTGRRVGVYSEEVIQTLIDLGLTVLQARVYLTLVKSGRATIKTIAKTSKIDRADVYRIVAKLQNLGLAKKEITSPVVYKATPINDGVTFLLSRKTEKISDLQKKAKELLNNFQESNLNVPFQEEDSQFQIISEKNLLYKTLDEKNRAVQKTLDVAGKWEGTRGILCSDELEVFKGALARGVKIRWVTENHEKDKMWMKVMLILQKSPLFEMRYFVPPIPLQTAIYDEKEVTMYIASAPDDEVTSMWSNNIKFVRVVGTYYEEIWNSAVKDFTENSVRFPKQKPLVP